LAGRCNSSDVRVHGSIGFQPRANITGQVLALGACVYNQDRVAGLLIEYRNIGVLFGKEGGDIASKKVYLQVDTALNY